MLKLRYAPKMYLSFTSLVTVALLLASGSKVYADTSISYYAGVIEFIFADDYVAGQYVNGDWWVHNNGEAVVIESITPVSSSNGGRIVNGTQVNPSNTGDQGYDSESRDMEYVASLNVDPGISGESLIVAPGSTIIKSISTAGTAGRPILSDVAILTVVKESPPPGSFRPAYVGIDKSPPANLDELDFAALGKYQPLASTPPIATYYDAMSRPWLEYYTDWRARDIHPRNHMPVYGRDMAKLSGEIAVQLQLNYTNDEKLPALIGMVQYGLDIFAVSQQPGIDGGGKYWYNNGGHNVGRKMPLLLTAKVLNNPSMLALADAANAQIFQEDQQNFYVTQGDIDYSIANLDSSRAYSQADLGLPEWAARYFDQPRTMNKQWTATYRDVVGSAQIAHVLAAHMMGVVDEWNWPALFDYADRYFEIEGDQAEDSIGGNEIHSVIADLWMAYRDVDQPPNDEGSGYLVVPISNGKIVVVPH